MHPLFISKRLGCPTAGHRELILLLTCGTCRFCAGSGPFNDIQLHPPTFFFNPTTAINRHCGHWVWPVLNELLAMGEGVPLLGYFPQIIFTFAKLVATLNVPLTPSCVWMVQFWLYKEYIISTVIDLGGLVLIMLVNCQQTCVFCIYKMGACSSRNCKTRHTSFCV